MHRVLSWFVCFPLPQLDGSRPGDGEVPVAMSMNPFPLAKALWGMVMKLTGRLSIRERCSIDMAGVPTIRVLLPSATPAVDIPEVRRARLRIRTGPSSGGQPASASAFIFNPFERRGAKAGGGKGAAGGGGDRVMASRVARMYRLLGGVPAPAAQPSATYFTLSSPSAATTPSLDAPFVGPRPGETMSFVAGSTVRLRVGLVNALPIPLRLGVSVVARLGRPDANGVGGAAAGRAALPDATKLSYWLAGDDTSQPGVPEGCLVGDEVVLRLPVSRDVVPVRGWSVARTNHVHGGRCSGSSRMPVSRLRYSGGRHVANSGRSAECKRRCRQRRPSYTVWRVCSLWWLTMDTHRLGMASTAALCVGVCVCVPLS